MVLKRRLAACAAVLGAVAVPLAPASAAIGDAPANPGLGSPRCPAGYSGPTNLATGCPFWVMVTDTGAPWPWWLVH